MDQIDFDFDFNFDSIDFTDVHLSDIDSLYDGIDNNDLSFNDQPPIYENNNFIDALDEIQNNNVDVNIMNISDLHELFRSENNKDEINNRKILYSLWKNKKDQLNSQVPDVINEASINYKITRKKYYNKSRETILKRKKEIVTCECGAVLKRGNLWNHKTLTKSHRINMMDKYPLDQQLSTINNTKSRKKQKKSLIDIDEIL